ncbi:MAG: hypothetical protein ABEK59_13290 [Halobacteria archaeon]
MDSARLFSLSYSVFGFSLIAMGIRGYLDDAGFVFSWFPLVLGFLTAAGGIYSTWNPPNVNRSKRLEIAGTVLSLLASMFIFGKVLM